MDTAYTAYRTQCAVVGAVPMSSNAYRAMTRMGRMEGHYVYTEECQATGIVPMSFITWSNSIDNVFPPAPIQDQQDADEELQENPEQPVMVTEEAEDPK